MDGRGLASRCWTHGRLIRHDPDCSHGCKKARGTPGRQTLSDDTRVFAVRSSQLLGRPARPRAAGHRAMKGRECPVCGSTDTAPAPELADAMLSDGRMLGFKLRKTSCRSCAACFHVQMPSADVINGWYDTGYGLLTASPQADRMRAKAYAAFLEPHLPAGAAQVLEVGAGSGALMMALAETRETALFTGVEPAAEFGEQALSARVKLLRGTAASLDASLVYDAAVTVNVIEHTPDPAGFLADIAGRVRAGGTTIVICPDGTDANDELLFADHLFTFSVVAMRIAAASAGLSIRADGLAPPSLGRFHWYVMAHDAKTADHHPLGCRSHAVIASRSAYFERWRDLDSQLIERLGPGPLHAFGAGQMAALLRAYAPRSWDYVDKVALDDPAEAWQLGKPVICSEEIPPASRLLLAVASRSQKAIAARLQAENHHPICFDDLVPDHLPVGKT